MNPFYPGYSYNIPMMPEYPHPQAPLYFMPPGAYPQPWPPMSIPQLPMPDFMQLQGLEELYPNGFHFEPYGYLGVLNYYSPEEFAAAVRKVIPGADNIDDIYQYLKVTTSINDLTIQEAALLKRIIEQLGPNALGEVANFDVRMHEDYQAARKGMFQLSFGAMILGFLVAGTSLWTVNNLLKKQPRKRTKK